MSSERELLDRMAEALKAAVSRGVQHVFSFDLDKSRILEAEHDAIINAANSSLSAYNAYISQQPSGAEKIIANLRKRVHMVERHNQWFERCESAWCNPTSDNDPAAGDVGLAWKPDDPVRTLGADGHFEDCPCDLSSWHSKKGYALACSRTKLCEFCTCRLSEGKEGL